MAGGNTTPGVVRNGDTVRRPRGERAEFAARSLIVLHELGFHWAPRYLGVDDEGRDVLSYVDGVTTDHPSDRDERCYDAMGRILRDLHDRTRGTSLAAGGDCLVHGDPAPFNTVMQGGMPSALIDWDSVHAGDPLEDVGYAGWTWCIQGLGNVPIVDQADRLRRFRDGYDPHLAADVLLRAIESRQLWIETEEGRVRERSTTPPVRRAHAAAAIDWAERDRTLLLQHRATFMSALTN